VQGPGFSFSVPDGWTTRRSGRALVAANGSSTLSATVYTLLKPYRPSLFPRAAKELDGLAAKLAAQGGGTLSERTTTVVDGRRIRAYRYESKGVPTRIGFVLVGRREYQLLCRGDTGKPCDLLFSSFSVA
jgi:hypothetical protein